MLLFSLLLLTLFVLHLPFLNLPYFWDEAGYYIPATRDLLLGGGLMPHSTPSNAHPPLVMAYLALWCKLFGYAPPVVRTAMLTIAAFSLLGLYRLAIEVCNFEVAVGATICTALYPVFFVQSSLAHLDMAAAGLTFWGLRSSIEDRRAQTVFWFSLAALAKETAILTPLALLAWEVFCPWLQSKYAETLCLYPRRRWSSALLLVPLIPLGLWYAYHYVRTGFVFGNPEFFRYNVEATLHPLRIFLALLLRFEPPRPLGHWQLDNTLIALGVGIVVLAASVWIVYTLEILKSRHLQVLRRGKLAQEPEREEAVERALTAGGRH